MAKCLNCATILKGSYCHHCGEKQFDPKEKSLRHFLGVLLDALTFADKKGLHSIWLLVRKPGLLSHAYKQGIRKKYARPLNLFLLANLLYFLLPIYQTFNTDYYHQLNSQSYSGWVKAKVVQIQQQSGMEESAYAAAFNQQSAQLAKLLMLVFVGCWAFFSYLLFYRKGAYFTDFLQLSFEFNSFLVYYATVGLSLLSVLIYRLFGWQGNDDVLSLVVFVLSFSWLWQAFRLHFGWGKIKASAAALAGVFLMATSLLLYRFLLLWASIYTL
jgi:hypothetical protein